MMLRILLQNMKEKIELVYKVIIKRRVQLSKILKMMQTFIKAQRKKSL
jgi:hypothetical protein